MLKKRISKKIRWIIKLLLPFFFKILIKLRLNRRVINFLNEKSYFSNDSHNFSNLINAILKDKKLISLDVGAQGGFNSDNFFPEKYNKFFNCILVEPIKSEAEKLERKNNISSTKILNYLKKYYKRNKFVRIYKKNELIGTKNVINTNYCDISVCETANKNTLVILSAIDNLVKGGAVQAV